MIIANGRDVCILHHIFDDSFKGNHFSGKKKKESSGLKIFYFGDDRLRIQEKEHYEPGTD